MTAPDPIALAERILQFKTFHAGRKGTCVDILVSVESRDLIVTALRALAAPGETAAERTEVRLQELYEIADGATGTNPMMRGNAVKAIREMGHEYPAAETTVEAAPVEAKPVAWPRAPGKFVENPDHVLTGNPEVDSVIDRLLDAQRDINHAANEGMDQSLCDASQLIDDVESWLRAAAREFVELGAEFVEERHPSGKLALGARACLARIDDALAAAGGKE